MSQKHLISYLYIINNKNISKWSSQFYSVLKSCMTKLVFNHVDLLGDLTASCDTIDQGQQHGSKNEEALKGWGWGHQRGRVWWEGVPLPTSERSREGLCPLPRKILDFGLSFYQQAIYYSSASCYLLKNLWRGSSKTCTYFPCSPYFFI